MNFELFLKKWKAILTIPFKYESNGRGTDFSPPSSFFEVMEIIRKHIPPNRYPNMLNIGAGAGVETKLLSEIGYNVIGTTIGKDNIKYAHEHLNIELIEMEMHNLEFDDGIFDCIVEIQTYEHAFSAWLHTIELRRVLRDGGKVFIDIPSPDAYDMLDNIWHVNCLYPNQVDSFFRKAGFIKVWQDDSEYRSIYEKLPDGSWELWGYVKIIMDYMK